MDKKQAKSSNLEKKVHPLADRVLIKEIDQRKEKVTKSGIIIPETVDQEHGAHRGIVMAIGEGRYDDGVLIPMKVKVGDTVIFQWGDKLTIDGEEYWIINESSVLAVIK